MAGNIESTVLHEHRKIVTLRHLLAIVNFIAILAGTLVTRYYVLIRGTSEGVLLTINIMWIINIVQILLCTTDYLLKVLFGKYLSVLVKISYIVGGVWLLVVAAELVFGSLALGDLRIDLTVIAALQILTALIAYIVWPALDHMAIQSMTSPSARDDSDIRTKKAQFSAACYIVICVLMVVLQAGMLFAYKLPPKVYDLFSESRAVQYKLTEDDNGNAAYEVIGLYEGTSNFVNIPAVYNNKPVIKIAKGALSNASLLELYKIATIEIGTPVKNDAGTVISYESNLQIIEAGAIDNDKITTLWIPVSVIKMEDGAISSDTLKEVTYEAKADFSYSYLDCPALANITFHGTEAGRIVSLEGLDIAKTTIKVSKDNYNAYREKNKEYMASLRPILGDTEFVIDFYTDSDYYIESIFGNMNDGMELGYQDLKSDVLEGTAISVDTLAYIKNKHETGTAGAKIDSAFRGWYYDKSFTEECVFTEDGKLKFTKDTAIYAKWIPEYTGTLDWTTFRPETEKAVYYWTDEDLVTFPNYVSDGKVRDGYAGGIKWFLGDSEITSSQNISESVNIVGKWIFDTPVVDIKPSSQNEALEDFVISTDGNTVTFTYDETQAVILDAVMSHAIENSSFNGVNFSYATDWIKVGDAGYSKADSSVSMANVAESGEYKLVVTAKSPYGETSSSETGIKIIINRKELDLGDAVLSNYESVYNSQIQNTTYGGTVVTERINVVYRYFDENGEEIVSAKNSGVRDAGRYTVTAFFEKNNAEEAANYGTKELTADFVITPKQLQSTGWSSSSLIYNSADQMVTLNLSGIYEMDIDSFSLNYEGNIAKDAGTYTAIATATANSNYSISEIREQNLTVHTWTIVPQSVTVDETSWMIDGSNTSDFKVIYNGQQHVISVTPQGIWPADIGNVAFVFDETANTMAATDANTYNAKIIGLTNANYTLGDPDGEQWNRTWEIEKRKITVTFDSVDSLIYNGAKQSFNAILSNIVEADLENFTREMFLYEGKTSGVDVGEALIDDNNLIIPFGVRNAASYVLALTGIDSAASVHRNYEIEAAETKNVEILPKSLSFISDGEYIYNGLNRPIGIKVQGIAASDIGNIAFDKFTVTGATAGEAVGSDYMLTLTAKDAGSYAITVSAFDNSNYVMEETTLNAVINKKVITVDWFIADNAAGASASKLTNDKSVVYNYAGYDVFVNVVNAQNGEEPVILLTGASGKNATGYTTSATLADVSDADVNKNYIFEDVSISWEITPYEVDFSWNINGAPVNISGGNVPSLEYNQNVMNVTPVYNLLGEDSITVSYASGFADIAKTNATEVNYKVTVSDLGNSNYKIGDGASFEWKITPRIITVNWSDANAKNITYDGYSHGLAFTVSGLAQYENRYLLATISDKDGSKNEQIYFSTTSDSYEYSVSGDGFTVDAGDYTVEITALYDTATGRIDNNYKVESAKQTIKIAKKPIYLGGWQYSSKGVAMGAYSSDITLVYNAGAYTFSNSILTELCARDGVTDTVNLSYTNFMYTNAGNYTTEVTLSGTHRDNYYIAEGNSISWSIAKKVITVEWAENNFVYDGSQKIQNATILRQGETDYDRRAYDGDNLRLTYGGDKSTNAGSYTASIASLEGASANNYILDESCKSYEWSIAPKAVNITWSATTLVYNGVIQHPSAYYGTVEAEYTAVDSKNVGTYTIRATGLKDSNYVIEDSVDTNWECTYSITPKVVNFTWGFGGNNNDAYNFEYNGTTKILNAYVATGTLCEGDVVNITYNTSNREIRNAGIYEVTVTGIDNANYQLTDSSNNKSITIEVYKRTVSSNNISWGYNGATSGAGNYTYDGSEKTIAAYINNICAGDDVTIDYGASNLVLRNAVDYQFTIIGLNGDDSGNYTLPSMITKNVTVSPKSLSFDWFFDNDESNVVKNFVFDGYSYTVNAKPSSSTLVAGDDVSVYFDTNERVLRNVGTYTYSIAGLSGEDAGNYSINSSYKSKSVTVSKQTVNITWEGNNSVVYDGNSHSLTAKVEVSVAGATIELTPFYANSTHSATDAKTYTFTVNGISDTSNYQLPTDGSQSATLTIAQQPVVITWSGEDKVTYDGNSHSFDVTVVAANNQSVGVNFKIDSFTNAGTHNVTVTLQNNNYTVSGSEYTKQLVIEPQTLQISWSGETGMVYDQGVFSMVYDGFTHKLTAVATNHLGQSVKVNVTPTTNARDVNEVVYTVSGIYYSADQTNYVIPTDGSESGILRITPQPVKILWNGSSASSFSEIYNGTTHTLIASVRGKNDNKDVTFNYDDSNASGIINVGSLTRSISLPSGSNYTLEGADGSTTASFAVVPQEVRISWVTEYEFDNGIKEFNPVVIGKLGNAVNISDIIFSGTPYASAPGTYTRTINGISNGNFTLDNCEGDTTATITIKPIDITVSWVGDSSAVYDGLEHTVTVTVTDKFGGIVFETTYSAQTVGSHTFEINFGSDLPYAESNYNITGETDFTIVISNK